MKTPVVRTAIAALLLMPAASANAEPDIEDLEQRLSVVERKLSGEALTEMVNNLRETRETMDKLRGQIEGMQKRLKDLEERQRNMYAELDQRLRTLETASRNNDRNDSDGGSDSEDDGDAKANDQPENAAQSADEEQRYNQAFETLRSGNYKEARQQFRALLEDHPDGEFADNARYWIGESYYVVREFDKAQEAFRAVLDNHPDSAKRSDALLKIGFIEFEQDDMEAARKTLQQVVDEHPDSSAANQARKRLERMGN
jgi:tol-pal system protein YbgF